jgi:methyl-accepting chemotaxis protein
MADQQGSRFNISLQTKIVFLVLFPMLLLAIVLSALEMRSSAERIQETSAKCSSKNAKIP